MSWVVFTVQESDGAASRRRASCYSVLFRVFELEREHGHGLELGIELRRDLGLEHGFELGHELEHGQGREGAKNSKHGLGVGLRVCQCFGKCRVAKCSAV